MAEEDGSDDKHLLSQPPDRPHPFLEVICTSSGKVRRFAAGTDAKFALSVLNGKLDIGNPLALHIEAIKEGEEPVSFGPCALLVDYGNGWKLQTVTKFEGGGIRKGEAFRPTMMHSVTDLNDSHPAKKASPSASSSIQYIGKIFLAVVLIFLLGATFTVALENLPRLILFINSSM